MLLLSTCSASAKKEAEALYTQGYNSAIKSLEEKDKLRKSALKVFNIEKTLLKNISRKKYYNFTKKDKKRALVKTNTL